MEGKICASNAVLRGVFKIGLCLSAVVFVVLSRGVKQGTETVNGPRVSLLGHCEAADSPSNQSGSKIGLSLPKGMILFAAAQRNDEKKPVRGEVQIAGQSYPIAGDEQPALEGSTFKRRHHGGGLLSSISGGLFDRNSRYGSSGTSESFYPLYEDDDYEEIIAPAQYAHHDTYEDHAGASSTYSSQSSRGRHAVVHQPSYHSYLSGDLLGRNIGSTPLLPSYHNRPVVGSGLSRRRNTYHRVSSGNAFHNICCADCPDRSIQCLAQCIRTGCNKVETCGSAGKGAYAAFCQSRCKVILGMSIRSVDFLPEEACRGYCAGNVQELCAANHCTDYGCYAPECGELAPLKCV